jgi:hypothetical protein
MLAPTVLVISTLFTARAVVFRNGQSLHKLPRIAGYKAWAEP